MSSIRRIGHPFKKSLEKVGDFLRFLISAVLLTIVYFIGIGAVSIVSKIFAKRFLKLKKDSKASSFWQDSNIGAAPLEEYYRQF